MNDLNVKSFMNQVAKFDADRNIDAKEQAAIFDMLDQLPADNGIMGSQYGSDRWNAMKELKHHSSETHRVRGEYAEQATSTGRQGR